MATTRVDIMIQQGAEFVLNIQARNNDQTVMNLTGYSAMMQVRETVSSADVLLEASTDEGSITINGPGGIVMVSIGSDITEALDWSSGVYDLEVYTGPTNVKRLIEGNASLSLEVTRSA